MSERLKSRLLTLERCHAAARPTCGVVTFGKNETPEEALERAQRNGMTGSVLLVPEVMTEEEWVQMMEQETNRASP